MSRLNPFPESQKVESRSGISAEPWAPQDWESDLAVRAWLYYRDTCQDLDAVANHVGISVDEVTEIADAHRWARRYRALQAHRARLREEHVTREQLQAASGVIAARLELCDTLANVLQREARALLEQRIAMGASGNLLKPTELARLLRDVIQLEQLLLGLPTERTEESKIDYSRLGDEELESLHALVSRAVTH